MQLSDEQKKIIIETAQELYKECFNIRREGDLFAHDVNITTFKEACDEMSCLVHYLAKEMYNIPDNENLIYECVFKYSGYEAPHYYNEICGRTVDSTIMQFNNFSPYDDHDECYTNKIKKEYRDIKIKNEIDLYKRKRFFAYQINQKKNKLTFIEKLKRFIRGKCNK